MGTASRQGNRSLPDVGATEAHADEVGARVPDSRLPATDSSYMDSPDGVDHAG